MPAPNSRPWFQIRIEAATPRVAQVFLGDNIGEDGQTSNDFIARMPKTGTVDEVEVGIHSNGGDVLEGLRIYDHLRAFPARITVRVTFAGSIAAVIAMAGDEPPRITPNGRLMIHEARVTGAQMQLRAGDAQSLADVMQSMNGQFVAALARHSRLPAAELQRLLHAETWITAEQAVEWGLASAIDSEAPRMVARVDLSRFTNVPQDVLALYGQTTEASMPFNLSQWLGGGSAEQNSQPAAQPTAQATEPEQPTALPPIQATTTGAQPLQVAPGTDSQMQPIQAAANGSWTQLDTAGTPQPTATVERTRIEAYVDQQIAAGQVRPEAREQQISTIEAATAALIPTAQAAPTVSAPVAQAQPTVDTALHAHVQQLTALMTAQMQQNSQLQAQFAQQAEQAEATRIEAAVDQMIASGQVRPGQRQLEIGTLRALPVEARATRLQAIASDRPLLTQPMREEFQTGEGDDAQVVAVNTWSYTRPPENEGGQSVSPQRQELEILAKAQAMAATMPGDQAYEQKLEAAILHLSGEPN